MRQGTGWRSGTGWVILHEVIHRAAQRLLVVAVWALAMTSIPVPTLAADEQGAPSARSGRRYWVEQAERDRERERQRRQETEDYRRQNDERQRRWSDWWSQHQQPPPAAPEPE